MLIVVVSVLIHARQLRTNIQFFLSYYYILSCYTNLCKKFETICRYNGRNNRSNIENSKARGGSNDKSVFNINEEDMNKESCSGT